MIPRANLWTAMFLGLEETAADPSDMYFGLILRGEGPAPPGWRTCGGMWRNGCPSCQRSRTYSSGVTGGPPGGRTKPSTSPATSVPTNGPRRGSHRSGR